MERAMHYILSIDAGITQTKVVLFNLHGKEIHKVLAENEIVGHDGRREMDMELFWERTAAVVRVLMDESETKPNEVCGIGLTGCGGGLWPVAADGSPAGNAILPIDQRAKEEADYVNEKTPGMGKLIHRNLGRPASAGSTLMLLRWLKKYDLEHYRKIKAVLLEKDWLRYKMTGRIVTDFSEGASSFLRFPNGRIPGQMLTVLELADAADKLPGVLESEGIAGKLKEDAALKMGLAPGTPVSVGAMDIVSETFGLGAITKNDMAVVLGNAPAAMMVHNKSDCDVGRYWQQFVCHIHDDEALELLSTLDIKANMEWALTELTGAIDYVLADKLAEQAEPGSGGVFFLPYLSARRDQVSSAPNTASGVFFGMTEHTTKQQLLRAVYEGIAYAIKDGVADWQTVGRIYLSGSDATEGILPRIIADVLNCTVEVSRGDEFCAKGAAMTCGIGIGAYQNCRDAVVQCCEAARVYEPNTKPVYQEGFDLYRDLRRALTAGWQNHHQFTQKFHLS